MFIDTHCHIHDKQYGFETEVTIAEAFQAGIKKLICVGTGYEDSRAAIEFANQHEKVFASIGVHPHDAKDWALNVDRFAALSKEKSVVAVGECGLDYFYANSPKELQAQALLQQLEIAKEANLPLIFHVRGSKENPQDAFDDFWPIYDQFNLKGVIHSFSAGKGTLDQIEERGLLVGLNGIMTFTKNVDQLAAAKAVKLEKMLLETDAPYLTPAPIRGKMNTPKNIALIAEFLAELRNESLEEIASATTHNAEQLFSLA